MRTRYKWLFTVPAVALTAAACASDPKIIVPNDFHGTARIAFCSGDSTRPLIHVAPSGGAQTGMCEKALTKFAVQRENGEAIPAPGMQLVTTGDGIVIGATFNIP